LRSVVKFKAKELLLGTLVVVGLQVFTLFRNFPETPKCGKIVEPFPGLNVLVNCDSSIFMKDADNPMRLLDGTSDYQDRPAHSALISIFLKLFKFLNLPDKTFSVTGLSGSQYSYSAISFILFILFNFFILFFACYLVAKTFRQLEPKSVFASNNVFKVCLLLVGLVSANELTKTFFWTPHSQMFNLLLPAAALHLLQKVRDFSLREFVLTDLAILVVVFFYPSFALLLVILLFAPVLNLFRRAFICGATLIPYALYPISINLLGGEYKNTAITKFREFIWVWDAIKEGSLPQSVAENAKVFLMTFPVIPTVLILLAFGISGFMNHEFNKGNLKRIITSPFSVFVITYFSYLYFLGFYSRRLTLGLIIFLSLTLVLYAMKKPPLKLERFIPYFAIILGFYILSSWFFTNGPMV